jgi:hypothetical protein
VGGWLVGSLIKIFFYLFWPFNESMFSVFNRLAGLGHPVIRTWKWCFHSRVFYLLLKIAISKSDG